MSTRLHAVVMDCADHDAQARWWAQTLGWAVVRADEHEAAIAPDADARSSAALDLEVVCVPLPEPKRGKNRGKNKVHLDLGGPTATARRELLEQVLTRGAHHVDIGQADVGWSVLADPEGNEFCVLAGDGQVDEPDVLVAVSVDARRPAPLARFWAHASGWRISCESHLVAKLRHPDRRRPTMDLVAVPDPTPGRARVHLDVAHDGDQRAEVERLTRLGARRLDEEPGDESGVVLADPEDNQFCVRSR